MDKELHPQGQGRLVTAEDKDWTNKNSQEIRDKGANEGCRKQMTKVGGKTKFCCVYQLC